LSSARGPRVWLSRANSIISTASKRSFWTRSGPDDFVACLDKVRSAYDPDGRFHSWMGGV
jgi:hypothetical protein